MKREVRADCLFIRFYISSNVNEVIKTVLNSLFLFCKKILHAQKAQKAQKARGRNQAKAQNATRYGGPTTPIKVLLYIRTKTRFLRPFKKSKIIFMTSFTRAVLNSLFFLRKFLHAPKAPKISFEQKLVSWDRLKSYF